MAPRARVSARDTPQKFGNLRTLVETKRALLHTQKPATMTPLQSATAWRSFAAAWYSSE